MYEGHMGMAPMIIGVKGKNKYMENQWLNIIPEWVMQVAGRRLGSGIAKDLLYCIIGHSVGEEDNFRLPEKTILKNTGMSARTLRGKNGARQKLIKLGWLDYKPATYYRIDYDKMYSDYLTYCFEDE